MRCAKGYVAIPVAVAGLSKTAATFLGEKTLVGLAFGSGYANSSFVIAGVTKANPGIMTFTGDAPSDGDELYISLVGGMTELNGQTVTYGAALGDIGVDTTAYSDYIAGGTAVKVGPGALAYGIAPHGEARAVTTVALYKPDGNAYVLQAFADSYVALSPALFAGVKYVALQFSDINGAIVQPPTAEPIWFIARDVD